MSTLHKVGVVYGKQVGERRKLTLNGRLMNSHALVESQHQHSQHDCHRNCFGNCLSAVDMAGASLDMSKGLFGISWYSNGQAVRTLGIWTVRPAQPCVAPDHLGQVPQVRQDLREVRRRRAHHRHHRSRPHQERPRQEL